LGGFQAGKGVGEGGDEEKIHIEAPDKVEKQ